MVPSPSIKSFKLSFDYSVPIFHTILYLIRYFVIYIPSFFLTYFLNQPIFSLSPSTPTHQISCLPKIRSLWKTFFLINPFPIFLLQMHVFPHSEPFYPSFQIEEENQTDSFNLLFINLPLIFLFFPFFSPFLPLFSPSEMNFFPNKNI